jgi:hypothetical protein
MEEERRPMDPTRKLLKVFGVKVTDYEDRTQRLLDRAAASPSKDEMRALLAEAAELTADLDHWLREIQSHVLDRQQTVLQQLARAGKEEP